MNILITGIIIFLISVFVIEMFFYSYRTIRNPDRAKIRKKLRRISSSERATQLPDILRKRVLSEVPALNQILLRISGIQRLDRLIYQANSQYPPGFFILLSPLLALSGFLGFSMIKISTVLCAILSAFLGASPFIYLKLKKKERMKKYQSQLPEALDLMARSLKAGHAFTTGMKMAAEEFDDPLGPEFNITLDEINFGAGVPDAMKNLAGRADCMDLNFFVIAVILQRETGGNLAEIMESIAHLIRERFKLMGKIRTLAAEGKLSMYVLLGLPFFVLAALLLLNPTYIMTLFTEPAGRIMCGIALIMMAMGAYVMKRMIDIKI